MCTGAEVCTGLGMRTAGWVICLSSEHQDYPNAWISPPPPSPFQKVIMQVNKELQMLIHHMTCSSAVVSDRCAVVRYVLKHTILQTDMKVESSQVNVDP